MNREKLNTWLEEREITLLLADGFDDALIGMTSDSPPRAVYSIEKCLEKLEKEDRMTPEQACDYFYFNVVGAYVGEETPVFIETFPEL